MSGIFGILDPKGPDPDQLAEAAERNAARGSPTVLVTGLWAVGILENERVSSSIARDGDSIALAWGRIDGSVARPGAASDDSPAEVVARAVRDRGSAGLEDLAADYAFAKVSSDGHAFLTRDAFGMRPLYWARRGERVGFSTDPDVLVHLGLIDQDLDPETVRRHLMFLPPRGSRTALSGLRQVVGGRWVDIGANTESGGRWFRPERVRQEPGLGRAQAAAMFEERLMAAVESRARGKVLLSLSAGRDSGAIAVALAATGANAATITLVLEGDEASDEREGAKGLASSVGLPWSSVSVPASVTRTDIDRAVRSMGPTAFPAFPLALAMVDAAAAGGADVLMDGTGGEPLFSASPVVVVDLIKRGRFSDAVTCARVYDRKWTYDTKFIVKTAARAVAPRTLLGLREQARRVAPWVVQDRCRAVDVDAPRTARQHLVASLAEQGRSDSGRLFQALSHDSGLEYAAPLLDLRLVDLALRLPDDQRAPLPHPKPVYAKVLGDLERTRRKTRQTRYFKYLAHMFQRDHPGCFDPRGVLASTGLVEVQWLPAVADDRWYIDSLPLVPLSAWLQLTEEA